jgi:hypothetical protein
MSDKEPQNQSPQVGVQQVKDMTPLSTGEKIVLVLVCMFLTPLVGLVAYLFFASNAPVKARQSAIISLIFLGLYIIPRCCVLFRLDVILDCNGLRSLPRKLKKLHLATPSKVCATLAQRRFQQGSDSVLQTFHIRLLYCLGTHSFAKMF